MMMMFLALIIVSAIVSASAQCPEVPAGGCNICGNDLVTGEPLCVQDSDTDDFLFGRRCGVLECEDRNKNVEASFCMLTQRLAVQLCNWHPARVWCVPVRCIGVPGCSRTSSITTRYVILYYVFTCSLLATCLA